jgi:hypothetical protein
MSETTTTPAAVAPTPVHAAPAPAAHVAATPVTVPGAGGGAPVGPEHNAAPAPTHVTHPLGPDGEPEPVGNAAQRAVAQLIASKLPKVVHVTAETESVPAETEQQKAQDDFHRKYQEATRAK